MTQAHTIKAANMKNDHITFAVQCSRNLAQIGQSAAEMWCHF